ncbi:hypothetical protein DFH27DRAFT_52132 [Peziza echinospora]|nr:hypothetical protein DFH27DRAFT_52132 [Peziza echinospora]
MPFQASPLARNYRYLCFSSNIGTYFHSLLITGHSTFMIPIMQIVRNLKVRIHLYILELGQFVTCTLNWGFFICT